MHNRVYKRHKSLLPCLINLPVIKLVIYIRYYIYISCALAIAQNRRSRPLLCCNSCCPAMLHDVLPGHVAPIATLFLGTLGPCRAAPSAAPSAALEFRGGRPLEHARAPQAHAHDGCATGASGITRDTNPTACCPRKSRCPRKSCCLGCHIGEFLFMTYPLHGLNMMLVHRQCSTLCRTYTPVDTTG